MAACVLFRTARIIPTGQKPCSLLGSTVANIHLWRFLNPIFNKVDEARVKEVGADRAAAEWMVRCGGAVRWRGQEKYHSDYNSLPGGRMTVEAMDATDSCIMDIGFAHLKGLQHLEELNLTSCDFIDDNSLRILAMYQKEQLQKLKIVSCPKITDAGLGYLVDMKALRSLVIGRLAAVDKPEESLAMLRKALPECNVVAQSWKT